MCCFWPQPIRNDWTWSASRLGAVHRPPDSNTLEEALVDRNPSLTSPSTALFQSQNRRDGCLRVDESGANNDVVSVLAEAIRAKGALSDPLSPLV